MVISWYGQACFRVQSGDIVVAIDPFSKEIGLVPPRFRADVVLVTHAHHDHSNHDAIAGEPFLICGPGEYEVKNIYIRGIETFHDEVVGKERGKNTVYAIEMEEVRLLHMGDFGEREMRDETLEAIGDIDILMVPVGGKYTIDGEQAAKAVKQIEPRFVIPMHYKIPGVKAPLDPVDAFLKEMGVKNGESEERLTCRKKDIGEDKKTDVRVLRPVR